MNEKSFESRRVRTQPCTRIGETGAVPCSASFTEVGEIVSLTILIRKPGTQEKQLFALQDQQLPIDVHAVAPTADKTVPFAKFSLRQSCFCLVVVACGCHDN